MIHFLRHIRQKFIVQENVRKYLLYAVGEILLVVIGILIALQVNTWNEDRIENNERIKLLSAIKFDFENALPAINKEIELTNIRINSLKTILNYSSGTSEIQSDSLKDLIVSALLVESLQQFNTSVEQAKATGQFTLIKSDEVQRAIHEVEYNLNEFNNGKDLLRELLDSPEVSEIFIRSDFLDFIDENFDASYSPGVHPSLNYNSESTEGFLKAPDTYIVFYQLYISNIANRLWLLDYKKSLEEALTQIKKELSL